MSGKTLLDQIDDVSEDDADFVPPARSPRASKRRRTQPPDSDTSSFESEDQEDPPSKRAKVVPEDDIERRRKEEQAKRNLQAILGVEEEAKREREFGLQVKGREELVEVKRPRFFAGETVYETVKLPKTHPDAIKYGAADSTSEAAQSGTTEQASTANEQPLAAEPTVASAPPPSSTTSAAPSDPSTAAKTASSTPDQPRKPPPLRRKPRQSLEAMNAALLAASKGKKMSMTEKSAHDWLAHTASNTALADQLAANRRENGGGFLEKEAFLGRVGERREALLERGKVRGR